MTDTFGSGRSLASFKADLKGLALHDVRAKAGDAFLLIHALDVASPAADTGKTGSLHDHGAPKLGSEDSTVWVFPVAKRSAVAFAFISVGRNEGNDIHVPHTSISRFHAIFRSSNGVTSLHDARSANGTWLGDTKVPKEGDGEAIPVAPGSTVRFGDVRCMFVDAQGLLEALR